MTDSQLEAALAAGASVPVSKALAAFRAALMPHTTVERLVRVMCVLWDGLPRDLKEFTAAELELGDGPGFSTPWSVRWAKEAARLPARIDPGRPPTVVAARMAAARPTIDQYTIPSTMVESWRDFASRAWALRTTDLARSGDVVADGRFNRLGARLAAGRILGGIVRAGSHLTFRRAADPVPANPSTEATWVVFDAAVRTVADIRKILDARVAADGRPVLEFLADAFPFPPRAAALRVGGLAAAAASVRARPADVSALVRGIEGGREWGILPVLADALEEAGVENRLVLDHCRHHPGRHGPGCWVLDWLSAALRG